jgi:hypothetical protein
MSGARRGISTTRRLLSGHTVEEGIGETKKFSCIKFPPLDLVLINASLSHQPLLVDGSISGTKEGKKREKKKKKKKKKKKERDGKDKQSVF